MKAKPILIYTIFSILVSIMTGCGSLSEGESTENKMMPSSNPEKIRVFKHPMGEVQLKGIPLRVVTLDFNYTEDLLALGIQPVGVADIASKTGFNSLVNIEPGLAENVADVGGRQEPNLEKIAELKPDLIIANLYFVKKNYTMLSEIAPTMIFDPYPSEGKNQYEEMVETFRTIADMLGKKEEAEQQLAHLKQTYEEARVVLATAGKEDLPVVLAQLFPGQTGPTIMLFSRNSQGANILKEIGLNNIYESPTFEPLGGTTTTVEALTALQQANFIYMNTDSSGGLETLLKQNALWEQLDFVKEKRDFPLERTVWGYGGPLSAKLLVQEIVKVLTRQ